MKKIIMFITVIIIIIFITIMIKNQETKVPVIQPVATPTSLPKEWNLEKELESIDPKVLDSDFNE